MYASLGLNELGKLCTTMFWGSMGMLSEPRVTVGAACGGWWPHKNYAPGHLYLLIFLFYFYIWLIIFHMLFKHFPTVCIIFDMLYLFVRWVASAKICLIQIVSVGTTRRRWCSCYALQNMLWQRGTDTWLVYVSQQLLPWQLWLQLDQPQCVYGCVGQFACCVMLFKWRHN